MRRNNLGIVARLSGCRGPFRIGQQLGRRRLGRGHARQLFRQLPRETASDPADFNWAKALQQAKPAVRNDEQLMHPFYCCSLALIGPN
jgi:hypothetical protein